MRQWDAAMKRRDKAQQWGVKAQIWGGASGEIPDSAWELEAGREKDRILEKAGSGPNAFGWYISFWKLIYYYDGESK